MPTDAFTTHRRGADGRSGGASRRACTARHARLPLVPTDTEARPLLLVAVHARVLQRLFTGPASCKRFHEIADPAGSMWLKSDVGEFDLLECLETLANVPAGRAGYAETMQDSPPRRSFRMRRCQEFSGECGALPQHPR